MLGILGGDDRCPVARSLDVLGEKWTLMIVRDALAGTTRFSRFQASLGIPRDVLAARLESLVQGGVLERVAYKDARRTREEYVLTDAGRELSVVLLALGTWADRHRPNPKRPRLRFVETQTREPLTASAVAGDRVIPVSHVSAELLDA